MTESRIEMHLVSLREQVVQRRRTDDPIRARRDDPHREQLQVCAGALRRAGRAAGWHGAALWTDPAQLFSLHLLEPRRGP